MTEDYKKVIANLVLDYFFEHEAVSTPRSNEVKDYVASKVQTNVERRQLDEIIGAVSRELLDKEVLTTNTETIYCIPSYYSTSRDTWQHIEMMDTTHIHNALQKLLRENDIIRRRTEARWLMQELARRAMSNV